MIQLLTYRLPKLMALLGAPHFGKLGLRAAAATSVEELLQRAAAGQPQLVVVPGDGNVPGEPVLRRLRASLTSERSLVLGAVESSRAAAAARPLYDGLICLDEPERLLARPQLPWLAPWTRRERRTAVRIPVRVDGGELGAIAGHTVDVAPGGAQVLLQRLPRQSGATEVEFHRSEGRRLTVRARAVWLDPRDVAAVRLGLHFLDLTYDMRKALDDLALWDVVNAPDGKNITLYGELSEASVLWPIAARVAAVPLLDLGHVARVNFVGMYRLIELLDQVPRGLGVRLQRVPAALMQQPAFHRLIARRCRLESYYASFDCEPCKMQVHTLVTRALAGAPIRCPICARPLEAPPEAETLPLGA